MENPTSYPVTGASEVGATTSNVVPQPPPAQPRPPSVNPVGVPGTFKTGATGATGAGAGTAGATGAGAGTAGATGAGGTGAGAMLGAVVADGLGVAVCVGVAEGLDVAPVDDNGELVGNSGDAPLPAVTDAVTSTAGTAMAETTTTAAADEIRILIKVVEARNQAITSAPQRLIGFSMPAGGHV
jgi:hypothetical protein